MLSPCACETCFVRSCVCPWSMLCLLCRAYAFLRVRGVRGAYSGSRSTWLGVQLEWGSSAAHDGLTHASGCAYGLRSAGSSGSSCQSGWVSSGTARGDGSFGRGSQIHEFFGTHSMCGSWLLGHAWKDDALGVREGCSGSSCGFAEGSFGSGR